MVILSYIYSIPYILFFLFLYFNTIPFNNSMVYQYKYFNFFQLFIPTIIIILFIGFRGFLYTDWQVYYSLYKKSSSLFDGLSKMNQFVKEWSDNFPYLERGFLIYLIICKTISQNYFFLQVISFIIDFFVLFCFFKKYIPRYVMFGFLFFFLFSGINIEFNLLRNAKSIMIFLLSIEYIYKKNIVIYFLLIFFASMFHISALLYLPLYFFINKKFHKIPVFIIFVVGNIIYLFQVQWCKSALLFISFLLPQRLAFLLETYLASDFFSKSYGITVGYLERFFSFIVVYKFYNKIYNKNNRNLIFVNGFYVYSFIFLYFSEITILLERVAVLFIFGYWIIYPQIYSLLSKNYKKMFLLFLLIYGIFKMGTGNNKIITEYDNILIIHKSYDVRRDRLEYYESRARK
jgi:hypothetical protein